MAQDLRAVEGIGHVLSIDAGAQLAADDRPAGQFLAVDQFQRLGVGFTVGGIGALGVVLAAALNPDPPFLGVGFWVWEQGRCPF